jgi:hypothetical protein
LIEKKKDEKRERKGEKGKKIEKERIYYNFF